jgi:hypothetical protein
MQRFWIGGSYDATDATKYVTSFISIIVAYVHTTTAI